MVTQRSGVSHASLKRTMLENKLETIFWLIEMRLHAARTIPKYGSRREEQDERRRRRRKRRRRGKRIRGRRREKAEEDKEEEQ